MQVVVLVWVMVMPAEAKEVRRAVVVRRLVSIVAVGVRRVRR